MSATSDGVHSKTLVSVTPAPFHDPASNENLTVAASDVIFSKI
ncbi:hypothetical protein FHW69_002814 [Luteibacter sp. Sphag1AF]|nr:hypothetical protein [Luteibacter sp. Sphag1AF]MBB3228179.1 hypothetical protein [Luteibacter sp. Sphag1AF]